VLTDINSVLNKIKEFIQLKLLFKMKKLITGGAGFIGSHVVIVR
jgi:hypothetical protein